MDERTVARLRSKIDKDGPVSTARPELGQCWLWKGNPSQTGYGYFWYAKKKRLAHRFVYEWLVGPIPDGLVIDHLCRRRICVNPAHLETVTDRVNILRGEGPPARNVLKNICGHGHPLDDENTYWYPNGERGCRTCRAQWVRDWRDKHFGADRVPYGERTHCPQGHPYDDVNTYVSPKGGRSCRACRRKTDREAKRAKRAREKAAGSAA